MAHIFTDEENRVWQTTLPGKKCSSCVAYIRDGKVLMVKASYKAYWTFPGGIVDASESPIIAANRESAEEIGFVPGVENLDFIAVAYSAPRHGFIDHLKFVFRSKIAPSDEGIIFRDLEIEDYRWVEFDMIAEMADHRGVYRQMSTLLGNTSPVYVET